LLKKNPPANPATELPVPEGRVDVENVVFRIKDLAIIKGASFRLAASESLGIIGPSASGKSTLARLLVGVWKPLSGAVRLDEPNANLDHDGEQALLRAMHGLKQEGVTFVVIAHRPSLLAGIDKILVLQAGTIEAFGPRNEIMARFKRPMREVA